MTEKEKNQKPAGSFTLTPWLTFALILVGLQILTSFMVVIMLLRLKMFPGIYMGAIILLFVLLAAASFLLLFMIDKARLTRGSYKSQKPFLRRGVGTLVSAITIIVCLISTMALDKLITTMNIVTAMKTVERENICVYVLKDDPANDIEDAKNYEFGITDAYDYENTMETLGQMEESVSQKLNTSLYEDAFSMIDALYAHEVRAIVMNQAYEDIIEEVENYGTFTKDTRILHFVILEKEVEETVAAVEEEENPEIDVTKDVFCMYVSGSDTRSDTLDRSRSDVNILVMVNPHTHQILMINTPRDYYIPISIGAGAEDKLTHCGIYGIHCSMDTLGDYYGIPADYYAQINFTGFEKLIDAIGGVDVYSDASFSLGDYYFKEGYNHVNGRAALAFARERHMFADGDRARGRHQMELISAIIRKVTGSTALITGYADIMKGLEGMFTTDFSSDNIAALVKMQLEDMPQWTISSYAVTGKDASSISTYSMPGQQVYVMIPDESTVQTARDKVQQLIKGEVIQ